MKIKHETVKYYVEDALDEIKKIVKGCEDKTLEEPDLLVYMEHAMHMFNFAYNAKHLTREEVSKLSQKEWEGFTQPPEEFK